MITAHGSFEPLHTNSAATGDKTAAKANTAQLIDAYKAMRLARLFDAKCIALQRTGQLGTYPSCEGAEAIGVGTAKAMQKDDVFIPYYRDLAAQLVRGVRLEEVLMYWGGDERGSDFQVPRQDMPNCIPIATQCTHACGIASAFKIRHQKRVAVCSLGDGATSKGDFSEALNLAGVWQLPVVFMINSNQWAISVPRRLQCAANNLCDKAIAAGFYGEQIDGNDVGAVFNAATRAINKARAGKGPTLIECMSYRLSDHTTADDASRYRDPLELANARQQDPIDQLRASLIQLNEWSDELETQLSERCQQQIDSAIARYQNTPPRPPESMFEHLYAKRPAQLDDQYKKLCAIDIAGGKDD